MIELRFSSELKAPAADVWSRVSTMAGVNAELMPLVRMGYPERFEPLRLADAPTGQVLFHSVLYLFGVLPMDVHALRLDAVHENGFDERSSSWLQREWIHRRRVEPTVSGARVTDELRICPRLALATPLVRLLVRWIFLHRHRRLRKHFGA